MSATIAETLSFLLQDAHPIEAVMLLNAYPSEYRTDFPLGRVGLQTHTFTTAALEFGLESLLSRMKLTPMQICSLYEKRRISTLEHLTFWDVPMQGTPIFGLILLTNYSWERKVADIQHLLNSGYIPTRTDVIRYRRLVAEDSMYTVLDSRSSFSISWEDILVGTRYSSYIRMYSLLLHEEHTTWETLLPRIREVRSYAHYDGICNTTTLFGDDLSTISPYHAIAIPENNVTYLLNIDDIRDYTNPYTRNVLSPSVIEAIALKKEFLWRNGFPERLLDLDVDFDASYRRDSVYLSERLDIGHTELLRKMHLVRTFIRSRGFFTHSTVEQVCAIANIYIDIHPGAKIELGIFLEFGDLMDE